MLSHHFGIFAHKEGKLHTQLLDDRDCASDTFVTCSKPDNRLLALGENGSILIVDVDGWSSNRYLVCMFQPWKGLTEPRYDSRTGLVDGRHN